jgi:hypothetical protein
MPFKRSKLLEIQLAFPKKELRRSKLLEKPITFSGFTLIPSESFHHLLQFLIHCMLNLFGIENVVGNSGM